MKNSSVSLSMLKVLRTCLAASQLTLNGAKESPWRCQCFLIRIITKLVTSVWAVDQATGPQLASKCSLFSLIFQNKKERKKVREVGILKKDPEAIREQIEKLEKMSK